MKKCKCVDEETFRAFCLYCDKITLHKFVDFNKSNPWKTKEIECIECTETQEYSTAIMRGR